MFGNSLYGWLEEYQIENIQKEAYESIKHFSQEDVNLINKYLEEIFKYWQFEFGTEPSGLLRNMGKDKTEKLSKEDIDRFEPWKCAGWGVENKIDMAFKLWIEEFEPFVSIQKKLGMEKILAILLLGEDQGTNSNSIFRAYDFILQRKIWEQDFYINQYKNKLKKIDEKRLERDKQLAEGRYIAAQRKSTKSQQYKKDWDHWAIETKKANPCWKLDEIAEHVHKTSEKMNHKMVNGKFYEFSTIRKHLRGYLKRYQASEKKVT